MRRLEGGMRLGDGVELRLKFSALGVCAAAVFGELFGLRRELEGETFAFLLSEFLLLRQGVKFELQYNTATSERTFEWCVVWKSTLVEVSEERSSRT